MNFNLCSLITPHLPKAGPPKTAPKMTHFTSERRLWLLNIFKVGLKGLFTRLSWSTFIAVCTILFASIQFIHSQFIHNSQFIHRLSASPVALGRSPRFGPPYPSHWAARPSSLVKWGSFQNGATKRRPHAVLRWSCTVLIASTKSWDDIGLL